MALNGPKSAPVALMTPTTAAKSKTQKLSTRAKIAPLMTISNDPASSILRLPTRSAIMVRNPPSTTSPKRVRVMKRPIW